MRKWIGLLLGLIMMLPLGAQIVPEELVCKEHQRFQSQLSRRNNSGVKHGYLIDYNRCKWWVNPIKGPYFKGDVMAHFTVITNTDSVGFDLSVNLKVDRVYGAGGQPLLYRRNGNQLYVYKAGGWMGGSRDSVGIVYQGNPSNGGGFGYFVHDNHMKGPIVHTLSEPYGAQYWWPCKQTLHDKIDSLDVWVYTDTSMKAASNGVVVRNEVLNDSQRLMVWKHRYPIVTYLVAIAVTNYSEYTQYAQLIGRSKPLPVLNYVFPQFRTDAERETKDVLPMIRLFDSLFVPYPFEKEKYGHAQFTWGGGMEHQTMSFMVNFSYDLMAHELAHQWFGDMVTCGTWQDLWLNEGFATYLTVMTTEYLRTKEESYGKLRGMRSNITGIDDGSVFPKDTLNVGSLFNGRLTYNKGAWVLHMLRDKLGDSAFFQGCRLYLNGKNTYHGFAKTADLEWYMEKASGRNLDTFFQQWYFGEGFPYLKINWKQKGKTVTLTCEQTPSHNSVPYWHVRIPLLLRGEGKEKLVLWEPKQLLGEMKLLVDFEVDTVIFDPYVRLLAKVSIGGMNLNKVQENAFVLFPNPTSGTFVLYARNPSAIVMEVFDAVGQKVMEMDTKGNVTKQLTVSLSALPAGPYFLRINDGNFVYSYKLLRN
jgi:aminopeptidase N